MTETSVFNSGMDESLIRSSVVDLFALSPTTGMMTDMKRAMSMVEMSEMKIIHQLGKNSSSEDANEEKSFTHDDDVGTVPNMSTSDQIDEDEDGYFFYEDALIADEHVFHDSFAKKKSDQTTDGESKENDDYANNPSRLGSCKSHLDFRSESLSREDEDEVSAPKTMRRTMSQSILKTSGSPRSSMTRTTSFSHLEIREYEITLGDNPGGHQGPPVSLGWEYDERRTQVVPLDHYEETRPPRRSRVEMYMTENIRRWRLIKEQGVPLKEVERASKNAASIRKQRRKSTQPDPLYGLKKKLGRIINAKG
jgi:hypothetical protein